MFLRIPQTTQKNYSKISTMLPYYLGLGMLLNQHAFRPLINIESINSRTNHDSHVQWESNISKINLLKKCLTLFR